MLQSKLLSYVSPTNGRVDMLSFLSRPVPRTTVSPLFTTFFENGNVLALRSDASDSSWAARDNPLSELVLVILLCSLNRGAEEGFSRAVNKVGR